MTCIIMQKSGAGCVTIAACHWDERKDNCIKVKWEDEYIIVLVTIFAMGIEPLDQAPPRA